MDPHSNSRALEQYVDGHLSEEDSSHVRTHLEVCEECQHRLSDIALNVQWNGPERRAEPRIPVSFPGRLKQLDPVTSGGPPHEVEVIDISNNGLKIRTSRHLIPKTLVQIRFKGQAVLGEVRYCIKTEHAFLAGVKLIEDFPET
jgi:PilZ domain/Putative zinc-finger